MTLTEKIVAGIILLAALGLGMYKGIVPHLTAGSFNPTGGNTYLLQSSISASQSTITLTSFIEPGSGTPYTMSYINTDVVYGTIAPSSGNSEFVAFTGITQNANSTATLTGVTRGLARTPGTGGCVASTTLAHAYPGQTQFILSNSPCFYAEYAVKKNDEYIRGQWTFQSTTTPHYFWNPSATAWTSLASTTFASKGYVDDQVTAGCANANTTTKGCVEIATALEAASSTTNGGTGAIIVYGNGMATDTPSQSAVSASKIAMSDLSGYLRQTWINLTQAFTFTALVKGTGGIWSSASTTIAANNTTTGALQLNGIPYQFPVSQSASSTVLMTSGSGVLTWNPLKVNAITVQTGTNSTTNTSTTTLSYAVLPANSLTTTQIVRVNVSEADKVGTCYFGIGLGNGSATTTISFISNNKDSGPFGAVLTNGLIVATSTTNQISTFFSQGMVAGLSAVSDLTDSHGSYALANFSPYTTTNQLYLSFDAAAKNGDGSTCYLNGLSVESLSQ